MKKSYSDSDRVISRRVFIPSVAVGVAAASACGKQHGVDDERHAADPVQGAAVPEMVVSAHYGGALGEGDDQECIQRTLDAAHSAGGGRVVLPPQPNGYVYKYSQLVIPRWVHFTGVGWHTFGASGAVSRLQQLEGVNDDSIIFSDNGETDTARPFIGPFGVTDLAIRGALGANAGHGISFRVSDHRTGLLQDMTTLERLLIRGFAGSGIYGRGGSPIRLDYITTLWNGRYGIEIEDTHSDRSNGSVHQLTLKHISGDGNMGGVEDRGGATIFLKGLLRKRASVSIFDIKSEYRQRPRTDSGNGESMGNLNALVLQDCTCPISVTGVEHIATGNQARRPGNAIEIRGKTRPDLVWHAVTVRDDHPIQIDGDRPYPVLDAVSNQAVDAPHGSIGPHLGTYQPHQIATQVDGDRTDELRAGEATLGRRTVTSANAALPDGTLQLTYFTARKGEEVAHIRTSCGASSADIPTLCRLGVYRVNDSGDLELIASTENQPDLWSRPDTVYDQMLKDAFTKERGNRYAVGALCVGGSSEPSLVGSVALLKEEAAQSPRLNGALHNQADLPVAIPASSILSTSVQFYAVLSPTSVTSDDD